MKGIATTHHGFEDIAAREIRELTGSKAEAKEAAVIFEIKSLTELCILAYKSQSATSVACLLAEFDAGSGIEETSVSLKKALSDTDVSPWISNNTTFMVKCRRTGKHEYTSQDIMVEAGRLIKDKNNKDINLDSPDIVFCVNVTGSKGYLGIDFGGVDLSKRDYRIFAHPAALKGTTAYCLARASGYKKNESLLDPFTKSGIIPVEAALYATNMPVNYHRKDELAFRHLKPLENENFEEFFKAIDAQIDTEARQPIHGMDSSMPSISAAKKNAKLAGVNKSISFSRMDIEWLDTKFSEGEVNRIVTSPPEHSKRMDAKLIEKLYKELFYQARYILSEKGTMTCIVRNAEMLKKAAEHDKFALHEERTVMLGKEEFTVISFSRR